MTMSGLSECSDILNFKKLWTKEFDSFSDILGALSSEKFSFITFASDPIHLHATENEQILLQHQRALFITQEFQVFNKYTPVSLRGILFSAAGLSPSRNLSILLFSETSQNVYLLETTGEFTGIQQRSRFSVPSDRIQGAEALAKRLLRDFPEVLLSFTSIVISDLKYNFFFYAAVALCCSHELYDFVGFDYAPWWYPHTCRIVAFFKSLSSHFNENLATTFLHFIYLLNSRQIIHLSALLDFAAVAFIEGNSQCHLVEALRMCVLPYVTPPSIRTKFERFYPPPNLDEPNDLRKALCDYLPAYVPNTFSSVKTLRWELEKCARWEAVNDSPEPQVRRTVLFWHDVLLHSFHQLGRQYDGECLLPVDLSDVEYILRTYRRPVRLKRLFDMAVAAFRWCVRDYLDGHVSSERMSFVELVDGLTNVPDAIKTIVKHPL